MRSDGGDGSWRDRTLYELATYQNGRAFRPADVGDEGLPVIKIAELNRGITDATKHYDGELDNKHLIDDGDLLFAWSGSPGIYRYPGPRGVLNQHIFKVTAASGVGQGFLRWLLEAQMPVFERIVADQATTMGHVKVADLKRLKAAIPPLNEQRRIAWVLGSLDGKIELNRRIAETLEQIAAAIFKARFVDFVGVEEFEESELGPIPKGWEVGSLGDHVEVVKGRSYKSAELAPSDTALVTLKSFQRGGGYTPRGAKAYTGEFKSEQEVKPGELVVAHTDLTQARDVIARPAIIRETPPYRRLVASLDLAVVRPSDERLSRSYLYGLFASDAFLQHAFGYANGSTVLHLNKAAIPDFRFALPPVEAIRDFTILADAAHSRIAQLEQEASTLASLRDALLPKLISGELRVPEEFGPATESDPETANSKFSATDSTSGDPEPATDITAEPASGDPEPTTDTPAGPDTEPAPTREEASSEAAELAG